MGKFLYLLTILVIYLYNIDAFGISSFGKAYTEPPKLTTTTSAPARQCSRQAECAGISSSSCVRTHYDPVTRYLYHVCANSDECNDGLICGQPNITGTAPAHMRVFTAQDKICLCDTENGYKEKEHSCNDAEILKTSVLALILVICVKKILV
ncbi:unnamed protein product [Leptidea sinapis]|uniref:UPAR/Ly6 domain-containing protein n=1 Tax=Leptidea sinapis TaxID=189913 RepID=A0A5E4QM13_9NEOP|nr:unnamed protein product [Leptidea sinapis]